MAALFIQPGRRGIAKLKATDLISDNEVRPDILLLIPG